MPIYKVQDPNTGRTIRLEGDSPPTEQELNQIFSTIGSNKTESKPQSLGDKLLYGNAIPTVTGTLGGIVGTALGLPGTVAGGAGGYAGGRILQENLQDLLGKQDQQPLEKVGDVAKGSAIEGASSGIGYGFGKLLGAVARPLGKFIYRSGQKIPQKVAEKAVQTTKDPVEEMIKTGLKGKPEKILQETQRLAASAWDDVGTAAANSGDDVVLTFNELSKQLMSNVDNAPIGDKAVVEKGFQKVADDIVKRFGTEYSVSDLVEINKLLNKSLYTAAGSKSTSLAATQMARDSIDDLIRSTIYSSSPEAGEALAKYGLFKDFQKIALKTGASEIKGKPINNLLNLMNIPFRITTNPTTSSNLGLGLYNLGNNLPPITAGAGAVLNPNLVRE